MDNKKSVCKMCGKSLKAFNESKNKWEKGDDVSAVKPQHIKKDFKKSYLDDTKRRYHKKCYKERMNEYYREIARRGVDYDHKLWVEYFIDI